MNSGIGQEFMEKTKYRYLETSDQEKDLPQPPLELGPPMDAGEIIDLPAPASLKLGEVLLRDVIETRQSLRTYSPQLLTVEELSYLLWCTQGVRKVVPGRTTFRTIPAAGARHPFETFLLVNRVEGLKSGLYRFLACDHRLVKLASKPDIAKRMVEACGGQEFVAASAVTFIWTAIPYRTTWRYGERGYRYMHLDAGHVCQNVYLAAEAIKAGACAIGAFSDDEMNELLGLDGVKQFVIYLAAVGKRK